MESLVVRVLPAVFLLLLFCNRGHSQCLQGLPTESELFSAAVTAENQTQLFRPPFLESWLFPSLVFNCTGSIYKWRVAADFVNQGGGLPVLIVWRQTSGSSMNYENTNSSAATNCPVQMGGNITVFESIPEQLLQFEPGDVLGWFLRPENIARFQPYLLRSNSSTDQSYYDVPPGRAPPSSFTTDSGRSSNVRPLLSVEICVSDDQTDGSYPQCTDIDLGALRTAQNCDPTTGPPVTTPTSSPPPPTSSPASALSKGILIVVIVVPAAVLILLLVTAIVVIVICCCRREPEKHPYPNEVPATDLIPMANNLHPSEYPGSTAVAQPPVNSVVISVQSGGYKNRHAHNHAPQGRQEDGTGSGEDQGAAYEEPMLLMSQSTEVPPPLPPPLHSPATFSGRGSPNFPLISPLSSSQTPTGTFRDRRHSPLPPLPPEASPPSATRTFYHTLERPEHNQSPRGSIGTPPISRTRSPDWIARHRLDSSSSQRLRARSVDELSRASEPQSPRQLFDNHLSVAGIVAGGSQPHTASQCQYHTLEGPVGIFVPTQEQRSQCLSEYEPLFDDKIYSCLKRSPNSPRKYNQFFKESDTYWKPAAEMTQLYLQLANKKYREIIRKQVQITEHLGSGEFGTVCGGVWRGIKGDLPVAVKMLNSKATEKDAVRFLQEAAIMGQFRHPNIVRMYGVVTVGEPVMIVLELMKKGDLRHHLKSLRPVPGELVPPRLPQNLLDYCSQIALGMEYLSRKEFVHRDLAARNVLLTDDCVCKIGDFGMSRDLDDDNYYISNGGKIPIKWTAPEAILYRKYSAASDVWSFGVLAYEIWSLGHTPFKHKSPEEAIKLIEEGHRLAPPPGCPKAIYSLMIECWHTEASARPSFTTLVQMLSQSDEVLLKWDNEEVKLPQPKTIGVPLELGEQLYPELQQRYIAAKSEYVEL